MSRPDGRISAKTRSRLKALAERPLSLQEWRARLEAPVTPEERENTRSLIRWFKRRYPTAGARLAYARRAYARWTR
jgi:hypothetical protein